MLPTFMFAQGKFKTAWPLTIVNGIKYGINEEEGYAEVRWMNPYYDGFEYSGDIVIASEIEYNYKKYPVKSIDNAAFQYSDITSVTIPNTVTDIGNKSFYQCMKLKSIDIPNSVEKIGDEVFYYCTSLKNVYIGNSLTSVGYAPFLSCDIETFEYHCNLKSGRFFGDVSKIDKTLKTVIVGDEVEKVGCFKNCRNLTDVRLGKNVSVLLENSFSDCISLTNIEFPKSLTSIGRYSFRESSNMKTIKSNNPTPPSLGMNAFPKSLYKDATLYVPKGSKDIYKERWGFSKIEEFDEATTNISTNLLDNKHEDRIYNLYGVQIDSHNMRKGIYIKNGKKVFKNK